MRISRHHLVTLLWATALTLSATVYTPATPEELVALAETTDCFQIGDEIQLPGDADSCFCEIQTNAVFTLQDRTLRFTEPGAAPITLKTVAQDAETQTATTNTATLGFIVSPAPETCPGGIWLYVGTANNTKWTLASNWKKLSGPDDGSTYPNGSDVCALVYMRGNGHTVQLPSNGDKITLGYLGIGDAKGISSVSLWRGPIVFKTTTPANAWVRFAATKENIRVTFISNMEFETSTDFDFCGAVGPSVYTSPGDEWLVPQGVTIRTIRSTPLSFKAAGWIDGSGGGWTHQGLWKGAGTIRFEANKFNWGGSASWLVHPFEGTIDLANGFLGSDHGACGLLMSWDDYSAAKELILRGVWQRKLGGACNTGSGSRKAITNVIERMHPRKVVLNGGYMHFGAIGNDQSGGPAVGTCDFKFPVEEFQIGGPGGMLRVHNITRYGSMDASTTTFDRLQVAKGAVADFALQSPAQLVVKNVPDGAVVYEDEVLLPFFRCWSPDGVSCQFGNYRVTVDPVSGVVTQKVLPQTVTSLTMEQEGQHVMYWNWDQFTLPSNDLSLRSLSSRPGFWSLWFKFPEEHSVLHLTGGFLADNSGIVGKMGAGVGQGSCTIDFGKRAYVYTMEGTPYPIGCRIQASDGYIVGSGAQELTADSSGCLSGGVFLHGLLRLAEGANLGRNDFSIYADGTLEVAAVQPFAPSVSLSIEDQAYLKAYGRVALESGTTVCSRLYVNGENLPRGTYGSSESGAATVDDLHFSGAGVLQVKSDDLIKPTLILLR
ncbi:MAG: hypothetical protein ACI4QD_07500 [Kiritimatiellia bacterium]